MTHLTQAQTQLRQLLVDLERANAPRIASLTATEAQDIRKGLLEKVEKIIAELYAVRNAGQLAKEGQVHVYHALGTMFRVAEGLRHQLGVRKPYWYQLNPMLILCECDE